VVGALIAASVLAMVPCTPSLADTAVTVFEDNFSSDPGTNGKWHDLVRANGDPTTELVWDPVDESLYLTMGGYGQTGWLWASHSLTERDWTMDLRYKTGGGSGGDGIVLAFYASPAVINGGLSQQGYWVHLDTFQNFWDPPAPYVGLSARLYGDGPPPSAFAHTGVDSRVGDNQWHDFRVDFEEGRVRVYLDDMNQAVLDHFIPAMDYSRDGISIWGGSGGRNNQHVIDGVKLFLPDAGPSVPVPEPATATILGAATLGVAAAVRRRRAKGGAARSRA